MLPSVNQHTTLTVENEIVPQLFDGLKRALVEMYNLLVSSETA